MKKKQFWAALLSVSLAVSMLSGCASRANVTEDMIPTVRDLRAEAPREEVQEPAEAKVVGLSMNKSYVAELTRLDGDNTEAAKVENKEISVVLKATSMDKDLKVKIVNEKNGKVITGTAFEISVTDANKKTQSYKDDDKDGIIYIKDMAPGKCNISMKSTGSYSAPKDITTDVKANIEYKAIDVSDEIKKESEINVAKEDSNTNGNSDAGTATIMTDSVEYVESTKTEIMRQKIDEYGTPMYVKIISEPAKHHVDEDKDGKCDRCGADVACTHTYVDEVTTAATCTAEGEKTSTCSICGDTKKEAIPKTAHNYQDGKCTVCGVVDGSHTHNYTVTTPPTCQTAGEQTCSTCNDKQSVPADPSKHSYDATTNKCTYCGQNNPDLVVNQPSDGTNSSEGTIQQPQSVQTIDATQSGEPGTASVRSNGLRLVSATATEKIVYDTTSEPVMEGTGTYKYTGWQTIDGATYYFDKEGNKVTGTQTIQGIQYTFSSEGVRSGTIGIDVSKFQKSINWTKVKNAGINFAIIRCGYRGYGSGVLVEDPMFRSHITGAKAAGLRVGVYFFSQAVTEAEAVEEASMAVKLAGTYGINMPIAIDSEYANGGAGRADGLSKADRTRITIAFCNTVANSGYTPMVYASKNWFSEHLDPSQFPSSYRIWVAQYAAKCTYGGRYDIWQNTSKGTVDGVSGNVDMNVSSI